MIKRACRRRTPEIDNKFVSLYKEKLCSGRYTQSRIPKTEYLIYSIKNHPTSSFLPQTYRYTRQEEALTKCPRHSCSFPKPQDRKQEQAVNHNPGRSRKQTCSRLKYSTLSATCLEPQPALTKIQMLLSRASMALIWVARPLSGGMWQLFTATLAPPKDV